jgi:hypothetical protein
VGQILLRKDWQKHQNLPREAMTLATYPPAMVAGLLFAAVALLIFGVLYIVNPNPPEK